MKAEDVFLIMGVLVITSLGKVGFAQVRYDRLHRVFALRHHLWSLVPGKTSSTNLVKRLQ